jgi:hypothetical protein
MVSRLKPSVSTVADSHRNSSMCAAAVVTSSHDTLVRWL